MLPPASVFSVLRVASAGTFILSLMSAPVAISLSWDLRSAVAGLKKAVRAFLRSLAHHRAQRVPEHLRASTFQSTLARWSGMLSVAAQSAFAAT